MPSPAVDGYTRGESTFTNRSQSRTPSSPSSPEDQLNTLGIEVDEADPEERKSFYIEAVDEMVEAVLEKERFLFNAEELGALEHYQSLDYEARYLFVRLYLRKPGWFRLENIGYENDIGDLEGAVKTLCQKKIQSASMKAEDENAAAGPSRSKNVDIDLTMDDDEEDIPKDESGSVSDFSRLAINEEGLRLLENAEILNLLDSEELESLAKRMKVTVPGKKLSKRGLMLALLSKTTNQATLPFIPVGKGKGKAKEEPPSKKRAKKGGIEVARDSKSKVVKQLSFVIDAALEIVGPSIHLAPNFIPLFDRLSLVYHRTAFTSSSGTSSLTASLLARSGKRTYPNYEVKRTFSIFKSREDLLAYEKALAFERQIDDALGDNYKKGTGGKVHADVQKEREDTWKAAVSALNNVYGQWEAFCEEGEKEEKREKTLDTKNLLYYRKRFHPGWPLTRVVYHSSAILARLGDHERENVLLQALLAQTTYQRGKRGAWYDRLALVLQNYPSKDEIAAGDNLPKKKARLRKHRLEEALAICLTGLEDEYTHQIYVNSLQRRVRRIESALGVPKKDRRVFESLTSAKPETVIGTRLGEAQVGKKGIWKGSDDSEISVEELALEHYVDIGWKGFHSENSILTTIFTLVCWDVIFAPVDGVFETRFQSAPLDLATDAFAIVRKSLIRARLASVKKGFAAKHLSIADDRERPLETWAVGVNWSYTKKDLLEIVKCIGGEGLAVLLQMLVEDYGHRSSGMSDLCLWDPSDETVMFVEVKSNNDRLSETQKNWIDVMGRAKIPVQICHVLTEEENEDRETRTKARVLKAKSKKRAHDTSDGEDSD